MALPAQSFAGVTPEHFASIMAEVAKDTGLAVSGNSGTASKSGFIVSWSYDPEVGVLTMQVLDKPWIVPASTVQSKIQELVQGN